MAETFLLALASQVADRRPVDWDSVESCSDNPDLAPIRALRQISELEEFHRRLQRATGVEVDAAVTPGKESGRWGHLDLLEVIGSGTFGQVFRARDVDLEREVALKLLFAPATESTRGERSILEEGRLLAKVKHTNVATVFGAGVHDNRVGIWMELVRGRTLKEIVSSSGPLGPKEATVVALDLCRALAEVHHQGILHRDIKAQNVIREEGGRIVLTDFGVGSDITRTGSEVGLAGTPLYLAPEVLAGEAESVRSEVYSLGVLLFFLVTAEFPFIGSSFEDIKLAHARALQRRLRDVRPDLPASFVRAVERALAATRGDRYASMGEMEESFSRLVGEESIANLGRQSVPALDVRQSDSVATENAWRFSKRFLILAIGLFVLAAATVAVVQRYLASTPAAQSPRVLLAEVMNRTADPELDAVEFVLRTQLQHAGRYRLLSTSEVQAGLSRMDRSEAESLDTETVREVAWRQEASYIIWCEVSSKDSGLQLSMRLEEVANVPSTPGSESVASFFAASKADLHEAIDGAATWIRRSLAGATDADGSLELSARRATTSSWKALDLYRRHRTIANAGQWEEAILLLLQAVELDPEFALAHASLGDLYRTFDAEKALPHWVRALELKDRKRLWDREAFLIEAQFAYDTGDMLRSLDAYTLWHLSSPREYRPVYGRAMSLRNLGREVEAIHIFEDSLRQWPAKPFTKNALAELYLTVGRYEDSRRAVDELIRENGSEPEWAATAAKNQGHLLFAEGDYAGATRAFERLLSSRDPYWVSRGYALAAASYAERGCLDRTRDLLRQGRDFDRTREKLSPFQAKKYLAEASIALTEHKRQECRLKCLRAVELSKEPMTLATAGTLLARAGFPEDAEALLHHLDLDLKIDVAMYTVAQHRIQGEVAEARGARAMALAELYRASRADSSASQKEYLARVLAADGRLGEALVLYRQIVDWPGRTLRDVETWGVLPGFWTATWMKVLELAEQTGERELAKRARRTLDDLSDQTGNPWWTSIFLPVGEWRSWLVGTSGALGSSSKTCGLGLRRAAG